MNLVLRALTLNDQPLSQAIVGCFDVKGGTIGRSDTNTMTLPDPERHISRLQAEVMAHEGQFVVRNAATANPIFVNGQALGPGERGVLANHDELRIGGYVLGVVIEADNEIVRTITHGRAVVDARAVIVNSAVEHRTDPRQMAQGRGTSRSGVPLSQPPMPQPSMPQASVPPAPALSTPPTAPPIQPAASSNPFADLLSPAPGGSSGSGTPGSSDPFADLLAPAPSSRAPVSPAAAVTPSSSDPFAGLLGTAGPASSGPASAASAADPFAFLNAPASPPSSALPVGPSAGAAPVPAPSSAPARLPDDFDPFADLAAAPPKPASPSPQQAGANDLLGLVGASSGTPASLDQSFGLGPASASSADPLADFLGKPAPSAAPSGAGAVSTDPLDMFRPAAAPPAPAKHAAANHTPELKAAYRPPSVAAPAPAPASVAAPVAAPVAPPVASPAPPASSVDILFASLGLDGDKGSGQSGDKGSGNASKPDPFAGILDAPPPPSASGARSHPQPSAAMPAAMPAAAAAPSGAPAPNAAASQAQSQAPSQALWAAFCEGAGVRIDLPQGLNPDQMRIIGKVMREATEGALRLMAVRATAKTELRAAVTTIRARNNNPLKFSPNAQAALEQLLQPPLRGFMAGPLAMQDAMHDLVGHSIGTMAGMRAALAGVLNKFEPGELERKLAAGSLLDSLVPMNRKAKLWDLYLQHFGSIRDDAQDDFHNLFGAAFVAAYEDQLDRLQPPAGDPGA